MLTLFENRHTLTSIRRERSVGKLCSFGLLAIPDDWMIHIVSYRHIHNFL